MSSLSRQQMVEFASRVNIENKSVFDVGSGPEQYWARNWLKGKPSNYYTLDINKDYNVDFTHDINYPFNIKQKFDVILCFETLEHVWNPIQAVKNLMNHARKDSHIYISTPFINPIHDTHDFLRYTDEWYLKVFKEYFEVPDVKAYTREATEGLSSLFDFYSKEGLRMSKIRLKKGESNKLKIIGYFIDVTV